MKAPPRWTEKQLANEAKKSAALFRQARLKPTEQWKTHVDSAAKQFEALFDLLQVVPTAVIAGVFKVGNLLQAQEVGLTLFWAHDLKKLGRFIKKTGEQSA